MTPAAKRVTVGFLSSERIVGTLCVKLTTRPSILLGITSELVFIWLVHVAGAACADKSVPWGDICEDMESAKEFASSIGITLDDKRPESCSEDTQVPKD